AFGESRIKGYSLPYHREEQTRMAASKRVSRPREARALPDKGYGTDSQTVARGAELTHGGHFG
ncbi:MAG: hypothetical protein QGH77_05195, partial [Planctomycetota bacterium]|nr:hypothetical protein [Planctomycetota bacterium]